jgi:hypothetical protein
MPPWGFVKIECGRDGDVDVQGMKPTVIPQAYVLLVIGSTDVGKWYMTCA